MNEETLPQLIELVEQLEKLTRGNLADLKYHLQTANSIWRLAPFKVGDRVQLAKTPNINEKDSWGWMGAKHFLIKGAAATVQVREFYDASFVFGLHFDDDSWLTPEGVKHMHDKKGLYMFRAAMLEPLQNKYTADTKVPLNTILSLHYEEGTEW
jgi:hypothetical protein